MDPQNPLRNRKRLQQSEAVPSLPAVSFSEIVKGLISLTVAYVIFVAVLSGVRMLFG